MTRIVTIPTRLLTITGRSAILAVRDSLADDLALDKLGDPIEDEEHDIDLDRAAEVVAADPSLIVLVAEIAYFGSEIESWARLGELWVRVQTVDPPAAGVDPRAPLPVVVRQNIPAGCQPLSQASLGPTLADFAAPAVEAFTAYLRSRLADRDDL